MIKRLLDWLLSACDSCDPIAMEKVFRGVIE